MVEIGRKRKIEKKGETAGPISLFFYFSNLKDQKFPFLFGCVEISWLSVRFATSIEVTAYRDMEKIDSRRSFPSLFMIFSCLSRKVFLSSCSCLGFGWPKIYVASYTGYNDHRHTMNPHPHFTCRYVCMRVYKNVLMLACVHLCVCVSVCVYRVLRQYCIWYITSGKKRRGNYI